MRVTQSMLSNNMLRNLSSSYNKMGKLQEQITTGKKVNRPSDDPVVVMKSMGYRMQVDKVAQYQRNLGEVNNYLDSSDDALDQVGSALKRASELVNKGATGSLTDDDREKIQSELSQIREQIQDMANTKIGDKYIFSGTKTSTPLFDKDTGLLTPDDPGFANSIEIEVFDGVSLKVNTNERDLFEGIDDIFEGLTGGNSAPTQDEFNAAMSSIDEKFSDVLTVRADIGARQNRSEMMGNRLDSQEGAAKKQMSENEDVDYEKAITDMITEEAVHRAALSVGARIIQPSLVDFLR
ncbi:flagellar hook-associated protein FlgL [Sporosarcina sp. ANT_H38]|uniref:flagellar hook-associated protein FlgL n=1 Tax=Sporosarcina sp. ANT_H38 TaxID=2597358 RepID=UPI0011F0DC66|nr:flagellar hook-associated protein FlgL [Sporosarcina sp. ANT_H38]KAA0966793.1 flagellar hook-associated protein FlgL [Sporosarcina sp. ANT_H38]